MQAPLSPSHVALLQGLQQLAHDDAGRDIATVHAWQPGAESARERADWLFVAAQVLTVGEMTSRWPLPGS